jgi:hypothetical protein
MANRNLRKVKRYLRAPFMDMSTGDYDSEYEKRWPINFGKAKKQMFRKELACQIERKNV